MLGSANLGPSVYLVFTVILSIKSGPFVTKFGTHGAADIY